MCVGGRRDRRHLPDTQSLRRSQSEEPMMAPTRTPITTSTGATGVRMTLTETRSSAGEGTGSARLDNLTLARKEGWRRFVNAPARIPTEPLTRAELGALS